MFYIFNWWPVLVAAGVFLIAVLLGFAASKIVAELVGTFVLENETIPKPIRSVLWAFTTVLGSVIIFLILNVILDFIGSFLGSNLWIFPVLGFPVGLILSLLFFIIAIYTFRAASSAANKPGRWKDKRKNSFESIMRWGVFITAFATVLVPAVMTILDENIFNGIPDWLEAFVEIIVDFAATGILAYKVMKILDKSYAKRNKKITLTGEESSTAIGNAQRSIATLAIGLQILVKTGIEMKHAQW